MLLTIFLSSDSGVLLSQQQLAIYWNLKALVHNDMVSLPDEPELLRELKLLKLKNGKSDHDVAGKDRADAVAEARSP